MNKGRPIHNPLGKGSIFGFSFAAIASFHLVYSVKAWPPLLLIFFYSLFRLANVKTGRQAFYIGLAIGLGIYGPQLAFFWTVFQVAAVSLWVVLSVWLGLFLCLGRFCFLRFGLIGWACAAPFFWSGLEYFRSELYYLRFSWLNAGYAFSDSACLPYAACYGVYGIGFVLMTIAAFLGVINKMDCRCRIAAGFIMAAVLVYPVFAPSPRISSGQMLQVTGVQLEFPIPADVILSLTGACKKFPKTDLLVLSEYTFSGPIPELIKSWCRKNRKYLAAGGEDPISSSQYYNTIFVVGPDGKIIFKQAKCVPLQFFKDGLPAISQQLWNSPWGKIGFGICYDDCFTRVTDELVRQGSQALIFPTMDLMDWGEYQHELHARMGPLRAAEYAVPVVRLCSSGISQFADARGCIRESVPFPGQEAILHAVIPLSKRGRLPPDRLLVKLSLLVTIVLTGWTAIEPFIFRQ